MDIRISLVILSTFADDDAEIKTFAGVVPWPPPPAGGWILVPDRQLMVASAAVPPLLVATNHNRPGVLVMNPAVPSTWVEGTVRASGAVTSMMESAPLDAMAERNMKNTGSLADGS